MATNDRTVTVFGGTGFLGRRIVRHLRDREFPVRIASRHPDRAHRQFGSDDPLLQSLEANIHDEGSVADALAGAYGVWLLKWNRARSSSVKSATSKPASVIFENTTPGPALSFL